MEVPSASNFENLSEANRALRQLVINNVVSVQARNDQHQAFFQHMQRDAVDFAEAMNSMPEVWTDTATNMVPVKSQALFSPTRYRYDNYPLWIIREKTRYGGSSLEHGRLGHTHESHITDVIVILKTGHLAVVNYFEHRENGLNYSPEYPLKADQVVDRKPFDSGDASRRLRTEWVGDLEKAARKYARKTK